MKDCLPTVAGLYPTEFSDQPAVDRSDLPTGWAPLVVNLLGDLKALTAAAGHSQGIRVQQVKEKFGGLRLYWSLDGEADVRMDILNQPGAGFVIPPDATSPLFEAIRARVAHAEQQSVTVCQFCSRAGSLRQAALWVTLCDECSTEFKKRQVRPEFESADTFPLADKTRCIETVVRSIDQDQQRLRLEDLEGRVYELARLTQGSGSANSGLETPWCASPCGRPMPSSARQWSADLVR